MRYRNKMLGAAIAAGLLLSGASPEGQAVKQGKTEAHSQGKPAAPVEIVGSTTASNATVTITFKVAAEDVGVRVYGTDGLQVVGSETPVTGRTFKAGETLQLAVAYRTPGPEQSNLAVVVSGQFGGSRRSRIASFTVGDKRPPSARRGVDANGKPIIVMPAQHR